MIQSTLSPGRTEKAVLGSKNGTLLNGAKIDRAVALKDGDEIRLGSIQLIYRSFSVLRSTRSFPGR